MRNARKTSQIFVLLVGPFGVLAFVCACRSKPADFPNGPTLEQWMAEQPTEFPKLSEP